MPTETARPTPPPSGRGAFVASSANSLARVSRSRAGYTLITQHSRALVLSVLLLALATVHECTLSEEDDRFKVYWNVPAIRCFKSYNMVLPLQDYTIRHNDGFTFIGDKIVLFYEYSTGLFPYFENYNASNAVNGGLPQKCDIARHLQIVEQQIIQNIPDENFDGPAVFDVEEWRPMYHLNWGAKSVYQAESIKLVRERFPSMSLKSAVLLATDEFNLASKKLLVSTLQLARRLRPRALWGLYGFPYCNYNAGKAGELTCSDAFQSHNDRLRWLTDELTLLTPSIYLELANNEDADLSFRYIHAIVKETRRIALTTNSRPQIMPYTKFEYNPYDPVNQHVYYSKKDLCNSLKHVSDMGVAGVLIWSTSRAMTADRCQNIFRNVGNSLGPASDLVRRRANRCAQERCSGHGHCVLRQTTSQCTFRLEPSEYLCECDSSFFGDSCEHSAHSAVVFPGSTGLAESHDESSELTGVQVDEMLSRLGTAHVIAQKTKNIENSETTAAAATFPTPPPSSMAMMEESTSSSAPSSESTPNPAPSSIPLLYSFDSELPPRSSFPSPRPLVAPPFFGIHSVTAVRRADEPATESIDGVLTAPDERGPGGVDVPAVVVVAEPVVP